MSLERLLHPRAIAIVGASADPTRIGGHPLRALQKAGYRGPIHPVNPKYREIAGLRCHSSVSAIGTPVDLAVIAVPAAQVGAAIEDCGAAGVAGAVVLTAGFRESGTEEGRRREAELKRLAAETGVRLIGPNCQGLITVEDRVWCVFGSVAEETDLRSGSVSCVFQSGGFGYAVVNLAEAQGVGFRYCISSGNETDVTTPELLNACLDDPGTELAFAYLEGTPDARQLLVLGEKSLALGKPILVWKGAQTEAGRRAAASHTANLTGSYDLYRAAFRQSGLIEVDDVEPIVDFAKAFAGKRLPAGRRVGVLSISGGSGIVLADRAVREGLELPDFSPATLAALRAVIPAFGSIHNPADVTAGVFNDMGLLTRTLEVVLADPGIDQVAVLLASIPGDPARTAAEAIAAAATGTDKPVLVGWSGRRAKSEAAYRVLEEARIAVLPTPVRVADTMARLARFAESRRRHARRPRLAVSSPERLRLPPLPQGACTLDEVESKALLRAAGLSVPNEFFVGLDRLNEIVALTEGLEPPFAVKLVSRDLPHKTEAGAVRLGVDRPGLPSACAAMLQSARLHAPAAQIDGLLVAEMVEGLEMLIGVVNDAAFGPSLALGLGGVLAELTRDVTHRIAPIDLDMAHEMIAELRCARLLDGYRRQPARDRAALARAIVAVSDLAMALGSRLDEIDVNPVMVGAAGGGVVAADALVVLRE